MKCRQVSLLLVLACIVWAGLLILSPAAVAHHGTSVSYDASKPTELTGVVTEFFWKNPHCAIFFDVTDEDGNIAHWGAEMNSIGVLARAGWTRNTWQAGDEITLTVSPSRAGTTTGVVDRDYPMYKNGEQVLGTGEFD